MKTTKPITAKSAASKNSKTPNAAKEYQKNNLVQHVLVQLLNPGMHNEAILQTTLKELATKNLDELFSQRYNVSNLHIAMLPIQKDWIDQAFKDGFAQFKENYTPELSNGTIFAFNLVNTCLMIESLPNPEQADVARQIVSILTPQQLEQYSCVEIKNKNFDFSCNIKWEDLIKKDYFKSIKDPLQSIILSLLTSKNPDDLNKKIIPKILPHLLANDALLPGLLKCMSLVYKSNPLIALGDSKEFLSNFGSNPAVVDAFKQTLIDHYSPATNYGVNYPKKGYNVSKPNAAKDVSRINIKQLSLYVNKATDDVKDKFFKDLLKTLVKIPMTYSYTSKSKELPQLSFSCTPSELTKMLTIIKGQKKATASEANGFFEHCVELKLTTKSITKADVDTEISDYLSALLSALGANELKPDPLKTQKQIQAVLKMFDSMSVQEINKTKSISSILGLCTNLPTANASKVLDDFLSLGLSIPTSFVSKSKKGSPPKGTFRLSEAQSIKQEKNMLSILAPKSSNDLTAQSEAKKYKI